MPVRGGRGAADWGAATALATECGECACNLGGGRTVERVRRRSARELPVGILAMPTEEAATADTINVGSQRQLFLDDSFVAQRDNVASTSHEAKKSGRPVIRPDQPWERGDFPDPGTPIEQTLRAMDDLVRQGKVRYPGCSNFEPRRLEEALSVSLRERLSPFACN